MTEDTPYGGFAWYDRNDKTYGTAFCLEAAMSLFNSSLKIDGVLCVRLPAAKIVTTASDAAHFFNDPRGKKIVWKDGYDRETVADRLVADNITNGAEAGVMLEALRTSVRRDDTQWYMLEDADKPLHRGVEDLV